MTSIPLFLEIPLNTVRLIVWCSHFIKNIILINCLFSPATKSWKHANFDIICIILSKMNIISKFPAKLCLSLVVLHITHFCLLVRFVVLEENDFSWLDTMSFGNGEFEPVLQRGTQGKAIFDTAGATCSSGTAATRDDEDEDASNQKSCDFSPSEGHDISSQKLLTCPEGCTKSFVRCSSLEKHCEYSAHVRALQDKTELSYA